jgi:peptidoglycan hydrolase-like protein with peptidoglycan-binding domain
MRTASFSVFLLFFLFQSTVWAQSYWIELISVKNQEEAIEKISNYLDLPGDISGFQSKSGYYSLSLGPLNIDKAQQTFNKLKNSNKILSNARIVDDTNFLSQFWPIKVLITQEILANQERKKIKDSAVSLATTENPSVKDTLNEAIEIENLLKRVEKNYIQLALKNLGLYSMGIDGTFGKGTRKAIGIWQENNKFPVTSVLTAYQTELLLGSYEDLLKTDGYELTTDLETGLKLILPTKLIKFDKHIFPFSHYINKNAESNVNGILISQPGDTTTLKDFYTLFKEFEKIPQPARNRFRKKYFSIKGENDDRSVYAYVELEENYLKGFLFDYPIIKREDLETAAYLARKTIQTTNGSIEKSDTPSSEEKRHFFSGIKLRLPKITRTGFFINQSGTIITTNKLIDNCYKLTLDKDIELKVEALHNGFVVLQPKNQLSPLNYLKFTQKFSKLDMPIFMSGYSDSGAFGFTSFNSGKILDLRGLRHERNIKQLLLISEESQTGAAIMNQSGSVIGMLMAYDKEGKSIPESISFSMKSSSIEKFLRKHNIIYHLEKDPRKLTSEKLMTIGEDSTALVNCW